MSFKEKLRKDINEAVKKKNELSVSVLRLLSASILNKEKEKRYKSGKAEDALLTDEEAIDAVFSEAKKRKEAIGLYERGGRADLAGKEKAELEILQKYLPERLSDDEIRKLAEEAIETTGAKEQKDMGKVMAELMPKIKSKADGGFVSGIIKDLLNAEK